MKTKKQKIEEMDECESLLEKSKAFFLVDFKRTPANEMNAIKKALIKSESALKVTKKTLLDILFNKKKDFKVDVFGAKGQIGAVFCGKGLDEIAGIVGGLVREKADKIPEFKMVVGYDIGSGRIFSEADMKRIGNLPPKEILIAQLIGMISSPLRSMLYVLDQISKNKK